MHLLRQKQSIYGLEQMLFLKLGLLHSIYYIISSLTNNPFTVIMQSLIMSRPYRQKHTSAIYTDPSEKLFIVVIMLFRPLGSPMPLFHFLLEETRIDPSCARNCYGCRYRDTSSAWRIPSSSLLNFQISFLS